MDEHLNRLIAAEREGRAIVEQARREADRLLQETKAEVERLARDTQATLDGLRAQKERELDADIEGARVASEDRIQVACGGVEAKLSAGRDRAADAVVKELVAPCSAD